MRVKLNEDWVVIPSSLDEITLKQRIDYQNQYGKELDAMAESIMAMEEGDEKEMEKAQFHVEKMFRTFAFFAGCEVDALKECEFIEKIAQIYYANLYQIFDQEEKLEPKQVFEWQDKVWELSSPFLKYGDRMKFGEFIDAKQVIQDLSKLGKSKWEALLPLCAIFLRQPDEDYDKSFLYEGSDRLKMMEELPMSIALQVAFFLNVSLNMFTKAFQSSDLQELKELAST